MRYDSGNGLLELDAAELAGAVRALEIRTGPIAPARLGGATGEDVRAFEDALPALPGTARDLLDEVVGILADPARTLEVRAVAGDAWLHRAVYAWRDGRLAMLAARSGRDVLGMSSADDVTSVLVAPLLADAPAFASDVRIELDGRAAIALVASADAIRYGRMAALASHAPAPEWLTATDVAARLEEAMLDDPRWSTNLFASVLPFDASAFMDVPTVGLALGRLASADLFAVTEADAGLPSLFAPTDEGLAVMESIADATGRVALTLYELAGGEIAYESMLLARGPLMLAAVDVAPGGGGVAALSSAAVTDLVARLAGP